MEWSFGALKATYDREKKELYIGGNLVSPADVNRLFHVVQAVQRDMRMHQAIEDRKEMLEELGIDALRRLPRTSRQGD